MTDLTGVLRLEVRTSASDVFVWGASTWTGYRFGSDADTPETGEEWTNLLGISHDITVKRGVKRDGLMYSLEAGVLNATILDPSVDPSTNPYIKPGAPVRLIQTDGVTDTLVFTGVVRQAKVTYEGKKVRISLSAVDRVKDLANINRSGTAQHSYKQRVESLLNKHGIPFTFVESPLVSILWQNHYESSLLNHLVLAATTDKGKVYVAKDNSVIALEQGAAMPDTPVINFMDTEPVLANDVSYTDIRASYDTEAFVNEIYVNNLTFGLNEDDEPISVETKHGPYRNERSIAEYGPYTEEVTINLEPFEVDFWANDLMATLTGPQIRVESVRWNATDNTSLAAALEVFDLVNVEYSNDSIHIGEDFTVLAIEHQITAGAFEHKWMVNVDLDKSLGGV